MTLVDAAPDPVTPSSIERTSHAGLEACSAPMVPGREVEDGEARLKPLHP